MKLIIHSDDLGISEAVSYGIVKAVREGVITCTGLFSNMPAAEMSVELIKGCEKVCLGQDINLVAGRPCSDPEQIPSLVQKNGLFKSSGMHRAIDKADGNQDHVLLEDCLIETEAQIKRFIELTGKTPEYLHGHSYSTPATIKAASVMGAKYGIPVVKEVHKKYGVVRLKRDWYKKPFPLQEQLEADPLKTIQADTEFLSHPYGCIISHCGYVDRELFDLTTYTLIRTIDLKAMTGDAMKKWIQDNKIELISYRDLV